MARPLRLEHAGALYHVTARGDRREDIFFENEDRSEFLSIRGECGRALIQGETLLGFPLDFLSRIEELAGDRWISVVLEKGKAQIAPKDMLIIVRRILDLASTGALDHPDIQEKLAEDIVSAGKVVEVDSLRNDLAGRLMACDYVDLKAATQLLLSDPMSTEFRELVLRAIRLSLNPDEEESGVAEQVANVPELSTFVETCLGLNQDKDDRALAADDVRANRGCAACDRLDALVHEGWRGHAPGNARRCWRPTRLRPYRAYLSGNAGGSQNWLSASWNRRISMAYLLRRNAVAIGDTTVDDATAVE